MAGPLADLILEAVGWASVQIFEWFYYRESSADALQGLCLMVRLSNRRIPLCFRVYRRLCTVVGLKVSFAKLLFIMVVLFCLTLFAGGIVLL